MTRTEAIRALANEKIEICHLNRRAMIDALEYALEDAEGGYSPKRWAERAAKMASALLREIE